MRVHAFISRLRVALPNEPIFLTSFRLYFMDKCDDLGGKSDGLIGQTKQLVDGRTRGMSSACGEFYDVAKKYVCERMFFFCSPSSVSSSMQAHIDASLIESSDIFICHMHLVCRARAP